MNHFTLVIINQQIVRIFSSKFVSFQFLNCLFLKNSISTSQYNHCNYAVKTMPHNNEINPNWDNEFGKAVFGTDRPFYVSTGGVSTNDSGYTPEQKGIPTVRRYETVGGNKTGGVNKGTGVPLRVINYNVLSQTLLEEHHYLYRKQSPEILAWNYRSKLIFQEILTVNPDIFCLQEVEGFHLSSFYKRFEEHGYKGVTKMKTGYKPDGLAIFYRAQDIKLLETENVEFRQPGVSQLATRDNVGLIVKLEKGGKKFIVANTHLLYNPKRGEVRLAQMQIFLAEIDRITRKVPENIGVLLMGDLNSTPESPVVTLLTQGKLLSIYRPLPPCLGISPKCVHLEQRSKLYHSEKRYDTSCDGNEEFLPTTVPTTSQITSVVNESFLLSHRFNFTSVYNLSGNEKRGVTTFQNEWALVDYIFYSNGFELVSRLTLPTAAECASFVHFLPNKLNPSDHLPLVADFLVY